MPGASLLTATLSTPATVPTDVSDAPQSLPCATSVATASGGGPAAARSLP